MSLAPLIWIAGGILLAGGVLTIGVRTIVRRRSTERRRLDSLGVVEAHREVRPRDGN
jgi:hypothetical protein